MTDKQFLEEAVRLAEANAIEGGGPFGAIIVKDGKVISGKANRVVNDLDPTAHAEVMAIREASRILKSIDLSGCTIYSSGEPCPMCMGAIYWARIDRVIYANSLDDSMKAGFEDAWMYHEFSLPNCERQVIMEYLPLPSSNRALEAWLNNPERMNYHINSKYSKKGEDGSIQS